MKPVSLAMLALVIQAMALPSANQDEDGDSTIKHTEHHWDTPPTTFHNSMTSHKASYTPEVPPPMEPMNRDGDKEPKVPLSRRQAGSTSKTTTKTSTSTTKTSSSSTTTKAPTSTTKSSTTTTRPTSTTTKPSSTTTKASSSAPKGPSTVDAASATTSKTTTRTSTTTTKPTTTTTIKTTTTTSKSTTTSKAASATRTLDVTGMTYQNAMLSAHNAHRANHSLSDLVWDQGLANTAQKIADNCTYGHNVDADGGGYGQNIGAGAPGNSAAGLITNLMYNGEYGYYPLPYGNDNPDLSNFHLWGHYSQLLWTDTTNVGCVTKYCPNGLANTGPGVAPYFTVCNYSPPGNYIGEFSEVAPPAGGGQVMVVVGS